MPEPIIIKTCCHCKVPKELEDFSKSKSGKLGWACRCRDCDRIACQRYAHSTKGDRSEKGKARRKRGDKGTRDKHPDRLKARYAISREIESGRMQSAKTRFCQHCGNQAELWHHWHGYEPEHALDVIALCQKCDISDHRQMSLAHSS